MLNGRILGKFKIPSRLYSKDDEYRGAYDRATLQKERQMIMQAWGDYCTSEIV